MRRSVPTQAASNKGGRRLSQRTSLANRIDALGRNHQMDLTPNRRLVLSVLLKSPVPIGAYDIMDTLSRETGRTFAPPTVYRALEYLLERGVIARIKSRNAFVPCAERATAEAPMFFICDHCGMSKQLDDKRLELLLAEDAATLGFHLTKRTVEVEGTCATCQSAN